MIEIKTRVEKDGNYKIDYSVRDSDFYEHVAIICALMETIQKQQPSLTTTNLLNIINKYYEDMQK